MGKAISSHGHVSTNPKYYKDRESKKWRRGQVSSKCQYCKDPFMQFSPWQKYCCDSHRVMAFQERKS